MQSQSKFYQNVIKTSKERTLWLCNIYGNISLQKLWKYFKKNNKETLDMLFGYSN